MASPAGQTFVFTVPAVKRAIDNLTKNQIHEHFTGYIAVLRAMRANGSHSAKPRDIAELHDRYLRAAGTPEKRPYIRPFKSRGKGLELFYENVAGSYAPSSIRSAGRLTHVLNVVGSRKDAEYGLRPDHANAALEWLLYSTKVPVVSLAAFLYRDYGFEIEEPQVNRILHIFRDEFGMRANVPDEETVFRTLFEDDSAEFPDTDLQLLGRNNG